jgi:hypothetical protein
MLARRLVPAVLIAVLAALTGRQARGDVPRIPPPAKDTLQEVLDHIRDHVASGAWQQEGWKDATIEAWLDKLMAAVAKSAELPDLKVPARLADVKPADPARPVREAALLVGKDLRVLGAQRSIVLADGNVEALIPRDCVIIARGVVTASGAKNCVIVAGTAVVGTHDGDAGIVTGGSLIVSRGWVDVTSAHGSLIAAQMGMTVGRSEGARFFNAEVPPPLNGFDRHRDSKSVRAVDLPVESLPIHPLAARMRFLGTVQAEVPEDAISRTRRNASGVVFRLDDRRYVADLGEPIVDEAGEPVEPLRDWTLIHASERMAVFRGGEAEAVIRAPAK